MKATLFQSFAVAGIDVGGDKKGCNLVVLRGSSVLCSVKSKVPEVLVEQCLAHEVVAVGVDSPCLWGVGARSRQAERELAKAGINSFSTPSREHAIAHTKGFYGWIFNGERVYRALAAAYPLLDAPSYSSGRACFETFPHAITCALLGKDIASAKQKRTQRRQLLENFGIDTTLLKSIDALDAALCALTARQLLDGKTYAYGDATEGYIQVPSGVRYGDELGQQTLAPHGACLEVMTIPKS